MTSKANKNRDDGPTLSSSISYSPCNLRRNQPQAGVIAKRTKSVKSKTKEFFGYYSSIHRRATRVTSNTSQLSSSEDEQLDESSETDEMECSDNEQTPRTVQNIEEVKNNKASVWKHFDQLDENVYMCQLCYK
ncbi:unnamed protein product, partial [Rotaria magnacalcarata]